MLRVDRNARRAGGTVAVVAAVLVRAGTASPPCLPDWDPNFGSIGFAGSVSALASFQDGPNPILVAGGSFTQVGSLAANNVASFDGVAWTPLGIGTDAPVLALAAFDDGQGPAIYAGGYFTNAGGVPALRVARWRAGQWSPLGAGFDGPVFALAVFDSGGGPALYAAGAFTRSGTTPVARVARWSGTQWQPLGAGFNGDVAALAVHDDGTGPRLVAGGAFTASGGTQVLRIARWTGSQWQSIGAGFNGTVTALASVTAVNLTGTGRLLVAGGSFTKSGGTTMHAIGRWNGTAWSPMGLGLNAPPTAITTFDDGRGPAVFVAGGFTSAGGLGAARVARWDGLGWSGLTSGANGPVVALAPFGGPLGATLVAGGSFTTAGNVPAASIARWGACPLEVVRVSGDVNADGSTDVVLRDSASGLVSAWIMTPAGMRTSRLSLPRVAVGSTVVGGAAFGQAPFAALLTRTSSGSLGRSISEGTATIGRGTIGAPSTAGATVEGTADFDGDGDGDILVRTSSNMVLVWEMQGGTRIGTRNVLDSPVDPSWEIVALVDRGASSVIAFLHVPTRQVGAWQLVGPRFLSATLVRSASGTTMVVPSDWSIAAGRAGDAALPVQLVLQRSDGPVGIWGLGASLGFQSAWWVDQANPASLRVQPN